MSKPIKQKRLFVIATNKEQFEAFCKGHIGHNEIVHLTHPNFLRAWTGATAEFTILSDAGSPENAAKFNGPLTTRNIKQIDIST